MPRIEGPEKKGIKRKKRRRAWASMDDILNSVDSSTKNVDQAPEATGDRVSDDTPAPTLDTQKSQSDQPRESGPNVPSSNQEQTGNKNQEHKLETDQDKQEHKLGTKTKNKGKPNQDHELGTNQVQEPSTDQEHKAGTSTGNINRVQEKDPNNTGDLEGNATNRVPKGEASQPGTNQDHELGTNQEHDSSEKIKELVKKVESLKDKGSQFNRVQTRNIYQVQSELPQRNVVDLDNQVQTENKLGTNQEQNSEQTQVNTENKEGTNQEQTGNVPGTIPVQNSVQNLEQIPKQTENRIQEQNPQRVTNESIESLEETYRLEQQILSLSGHAENCFRYISQRCFQNNQEPFETTYGFVSKSLEIHIETLKTTLKRLKKKNLIINQTLRMGGPAARRMLGIPRPVLAAYSKLLLHQKGSLETGNNPGTETGNKLGSKPGSKLGSSASSKLVSNNKLLTREGESETQLQKPKFSDIDISPLNSYGITTKHLRDIENQRLELTPHQLEDLIAKFAVYASDASNLHNVRNKAAIFIKMAQMLSRGEDPLPGVKSEEDRILEEFIARKLEAKKRRQELEKQAFDMEFDEWLESVDKTKRDELAPPNSIVSSGSEAQTKVLRQWFLDHEWPERKRGILGEI